MGGYTLFKNFILDPILSLIYFPLWWYSKGFLKFSNFLRKNIEELSQPFVLKILLANLFKPMYGDYSREGRIISFFMRIFHLFWRILKIVIVSILSLVILIIYLLLPIFIFYEIVCNFRNSCHYFLFPSII